MDISSALRTGLNAMQQSQQNMQVAAHEVASSVGTENRAVNTEALLDIKVEETLFTASAKVVSTADEALGKLLDVTA